MGEDEAPTTMTHVLSPVQQETGKQEASDRCASAGTQNGGQALTGKHERPIWGQQLNPRGVLSNPIAAKSMISWLGWSDLGQTL